MEKYIVRITDNLTVTLTADDIDCIMSSALDGGVTAYWCNQCQVDADDWHGYASEQLTHGHALIFTPDEGDGDVSMTLRDFLRGFKIWYVSDPGHSAEDYVFNTANIDAIEADCIVQFALFGELVYG